MVKPRYDLIGWRQELVKTTSKSLLSHSTPLAIQQPIGGANDPIATDPVLWGVFAIELGAAVTNPLTYSGGIGGPWTTSVRTSGGASRRSIGKSTAVRCWFPGTVSPITGTSTTWWVGRTQDQWNMLKHVETKKSVLRSWTLDTASINTPNPCRPSVLLAPLELPQSFQQFEPQLASGQWSLQPIRMNMFENRPTKLGQTKPEDGFAHMISRLEEVHANHIQPPMTNTDDSHQSRHQNWFSSMRPWSSTKRVQFLEQAKQWATQSDGTRCRISQRQIVNIKHLYLDR